MKTLKQIRTYLIPEEENNQCNVCGGRIVRVEGELVCSECGNVKGYELIYP